MKQRYKIVLYDWIFLVISWVIFMNIVYVITQSLQEYIDYGIFLEYANSWLGLLENTFFGIIFGSLFALIHHLTERPKIKRMPFSYIILIKSSLYLIGLCVATLILFGLWILLGALDETTFDEALKYLTTKGMIYTIIYMSFFILLTNFLMEVNRKFGYDNLWPILTGKYHKPRVENRLFMFLDLKGSTTIAEKLGHELYSRLIQSCFYDLTDIVIKHQAKIYQYVGDEVILTWTIEEGLRDQNCIRFFHDYKDKLHSRKQHYESNFNIIPEFKAGMEMGKVTAAEVGLIKREIAYHGDVLNTASRIQSCCNTFDKEILISENIKNALESTTQFHSEFKGEVQLKGKSIKTKIYSIEKSNFYLS